MPDDFLRDLAGRMKSDGGMPGATEQERLLASLTALLCFTAAGHSPTSGMCKDAVRQLVAFLNSANLAGLSDSRQGLVRGVVNLARVGEALPGDWRSLTVEPLPVDEIWQQLESGFPSLSPPPSSDLRELSGARTRSLIAHFGRCMEVFERHSPFQEVAQLERHQATISLRRRLGSAAAALNSDEFLHSLYQTLQAWRSGQRASLLKPFDSFCRSLRQQRDKVNREDGFRLEAATLPVNEVCQRLWLLIDSLDITDDESPIVESTQALHHLLPDLVVPIDHASTGRFFGWPADYSQRCNPFIFEVAFTCFARIARAVRASRYVGPGWRTCPTKIVENAVAGFVLAIDASAKEG
jgi:hypothetical protein